MARLATGTGVSVSVAVLLPGTVSVVPGGGVTVTLLVWLPVAGEAKGTVWVDVRLDPAGRFTVVLSPPVPLLAPATLAPPVAEPATNAQLVPLAVEPGGSVSTREAALTALGPLLLTTMV